jgi:hypothetical protein
MHRFLVRCLLALAVAVPAAGQSINIPIVLPGVLGDLTVGFDGVTGLSLPNLGVTVQLVSPLNPGLRARLPSTVSIPLVLPLLMKIQPPTNGGLAFTGVASVQLNTLLAPSSPRMYAASSSNDQYEDITASTVRVGSSYRVMGSKGGFSEFLIVSDHTPTATVIATKLDRLDQILADNAGAIAGGVRADLASQLAALRGHVESGQTATAIQDVDLFLATVEQHSGPEIPNVWRAARDLVNVAGLLGAGGETLRFSLQQELGQ